jgi:hypothetical protein
VLQSPNLMQELRVGRRLALSVVVAQLLGALLLLVLEWPASVSLIPEAPAWVFRIWLGAAFATPVGFVFGLAYQSFSGRSAPRLLTAVCAVGALAMPLVGLWLVSA